MKEYKLSEYKAPPFLIETIKLTLDLSQWEPLCDAELSLRVNPQSPETNATLVLHGENMRLLSLSLDHKALGDEEYAVTKDQLIIHKVPTDRPFTLSTSAKLGTNRDLFGIYHTEGTILAKAETEGMRRIMYCLDRPDVLAAYTTTIIADKNTYPVLLSNGIKVQESELENGLHSVTWSDPFPKPSYLFAIVAGTLTANASKFTTKNGKHIPIVFYVPENAREKCTFAQEVVQRVMRWDEDNYQIECDLPQHMIAGVDKYASGASEPTGLNLFNTENLYATPAIKTDLGILRVLEVVAHEYCHTLTGDRVTIANWFNLAWKEGLTTLRASLFCEDLFGEDIIKLIEGKNLDERAPRPDSYVAVRSLYTAAAYEKSAAIFRMMMLLMGKETFNAGLTAFLKDHYGEAVSIEQFIASLDGFSHGAHQIASFLPWFTETGIPCLFVTDTYDPDSKTYTLSVKTRDAKGRLVPLLLGLLAKDGKPLLGDTLVLVDKEEIEFTFRDLPSKPIPSLLRGFSAPVDCVYPYSVQDLLVLMQYDSNVLNRCDAAKQLMQKLIQIYDADDDQHLPNELIQTYKSIMAEADLDYWIKAELLTIPAEEELIAKSSQPDFEKIARARAAIVAELAKALQPEWASLLAQLQKESDVADPQIAFFDMHDAGKRRLMALSASYLLQVQPDSTKDFLYGLFQSSLKTNMTNTTNALLLLCEVDETLAQQALSDFYNYWQSDTHAMNYWLKVQAGKHSDTVRQDVEKILQDPCFDRLNPNKVQALIVSFIKNPYGFHHDSGEGYKLVADFILELEKDIPALAGKLTEPFIYWTRYTPGRQEAMLAAIQRINAECTSVDVKNIVQKAQIQDQK